MNASRVALTLLRRLGLGLSIIALASLALLLSDWRHRSPSAGMPRVAVFQYNSSLTLDLSVRGLIDSLREHGWVDGRTMEVRFFNAESDVGTMNSIAQELVSGKYTHVITISTPCLQAVARANRDGKVKHIFGAVADPLAARVGINPTNPYDHPKWMVGIGSFMPVGEVLEMARRLNPRLRSIGLPWNPAEANSQSYTHAAREAARRLGLELLEGNVENSTAVGEVTDSLVARGAEAILMTGDNTVASPPTRCSPPPARLGFPPWPPCLRRWATAPCSPLARIFTKSAARSATWPPVSFPVKIPPPCRSSTRFRRSFSLTAASLRN